ncbi:ribosome maturation factor RimP [Corynebacterium sp. 4HC-13]|uniref:ribosome maturation factor RimP n=1 Tax=Corynebacterium anserum TaxID=2684406 RepID=UPI0016397451|nr:ribosome maturation factor RimP [Corynebacterium anserum]MBC2681745.1 ribosome maturation factor RimP [Corynebacterium anserum]
MAFPTPSQLEDILNPLVTQYGMQLEQLKITKAGSKSAVRVAVDGDERPDLDILEEVSKAVSAAFDAAEESGALNFGPGYTLELTTPGLDFPLTLERHWKRNVGRVVTLPQAGSARILHVDEAGVVLLTKKKKNKTVVAREFADVEGAVVEVEFNQVPQDEAQLIGLDRHAYESLIAAAEENK